MDIQHLALFISQILIWYTEFFFASKLFFILFQKHESDCFFYAMFGLHLHFNGIDKWDGANKFSLSTSFKGILLSFIILSIFLCINLSSCIIKNKMLKIFKISIETYINLTANCFYSTYSLFFSKNRLAFLIQIFFVLSSSMLLSGFNNSNHTIVY